MATVGNYTATLTKVQDAQPLGTYKPTSIDERKANADIRILSVEDGKFTIESKIELKLGRGMKQPYTRKDLYEVTKKALEKLQTQYNVVTDF